MEQVPLRIMSRVAENASYLVKSLVEAFGGGENEASVDPAVLFGYDKLLISATEAGKVYAVQAWNGVVAWQSSFLGNIHKIFLKKVISREDSMEISEVAVVTDDKLITLDGLTGREISAEPLGIDASTSQLMLVSAQDDSQVILAVDKNDGKVLKAYGASRPVDVYYSTIDNEKGLVSGYKLGIDSKLWQVNLALEGSEAIHQVRTQR